MQELGDLRKLSTLVNSEYFPAHVTDDEIATILNEALHAVVQDTMVWARRHELNGRYRDAEYLFRRASSMESITMESISMESSKAENVLSNLVSIYEKMGDYPAAEIIQETVLKQLASRKSNEVSDEQYRMVCDYSRLLSLFKKRILELFPDDPILSPDLLITFRATILDIISLNKLLLEQHLIPLQFSEDNCCTSLHVAAAVGAINLARLLIEKGADINHRDPQQRTPLYLAARYSDSAMIELLLAHGADVKAIDIYDRTPLHAALYGSPSGETIACLINAKADIDATDMNEQTPLVLAIESDVSAVAHLLIEYGANIDPIAPSNETPIFTAISYDREWAVALLLENGLNLTRKNASGETALYFAVREGSESITRILLHYSALTNITVDRQNCGDKTVLQVAVQKANIAILAMLLNSGAYIHWPDQDGNTPLHRAVIEGREPYEQITRLLLAHSARVDAVTHTGETVLHLAVRHRRRNILPILLQSIEPDWLPFICEMRDKSGKTPIEIAQSLAKDTHESSVESSVLFMLENALKLSRSFIDRNLRTNVPAPTLLGFQDALEPSLLSL